MEVACIGQRETYGYDTVIWLIIVKKTQFKRPCKDHVYKTVSMDWFEWMQYPTTMLVVSDCDFDSFMVSFINVVYRCSGI